MAEEIKIGRQAIDAVASSLGRDLDTLCSFRLRSLTGAIPVAGSAEHDGRLAQLLERSVCSFRELMESDASALASMESSFAATDAAAAAALDAG